MPKVTDAGCAQPRDLLVGGLQGSQRRSASWSSCRWTPERQQILCEKTIHVKLEINGKIYGLQVPWFLSRYINEELEEGKPKNWYIDYPEIPGVVAWLAVVASIWSAWEPTARTGTALTSWTWMAPKFELNWVWIEFRHVKNRTKVTFMTDEWWYFCLWVGNDVFSYSRHKDFERS